MPKSKMTTCRVAVHDQGEKLRIYIIGNVKQKEYKKQVKKNDGPIVLFIEFPCLASDIDRVNKRKRSKNIDKTWDAVFQLTKEHWAIANIFHDSLSSTSNEIIIWPNLKT